MNNSDNIGLQAPKILLPKKNIDLSRWAVVACDQYTSQSTYWDAVEKFVGDHPSTYHLTLPEAYLGTDKGKIHADQVFSRMDTYISEDLFQEIHGFLIIRRSFDDLERLGLLAALDLEEYDFSKNSQSLIRATEGTIVDRLPPRIAIREKAIFEIPHILVLIDDPGKTVIEPLFESIEKEPVYDFDLMQGGGHITAFQVDSKDKKMAIISSLEKLKSPAIQSEKYNISPGTPPMLYAMGDGNHSLATAKAIWEKNKQHLPSDHPSRYALVEIVNLHDRGIEFEAIHRLIKGIDIDLESSCKDFFNQNISIQFEDNYRKLCESVDSNQSNQLNFGLFYNNNYLLITINQPIHTLSVGNAQAWIDHLIEESDISEVDYIHGKDTVHELGSQPDCAGIYLPAMPKNALFKSVIKDGPLPRKTFSMGEAHQKRFYLECRKIK